MNSKNKKILISGNEAIAEGAIQAGCRFYAGYPITPQNEIPSFMSRRMPQVGGIFIQTESEIAAINMVFGASCAGARAMTTSSSPGMSLKQEGISYLAGCMLPAVIANIMRGGPGLGNISPSQSDYMQAVKGGGHGDYHSIVLAPSNVGEMFEFTMLAFDLADIYRMPVIILADGMLGQMMEPISVKAADYRVGSTKKPWALTGAKGRKPNIIRSLLLKEGALEEFNEKLQEKYRHIEKKEVRFEVNNAGDSELLIVGYGTIARIVAGAVEDLRKQGLNVGLFRPISLWPFPSQALKRCAKGKKLLVVEMSCGQMVEDVRLSVDGLCPVEFFGHAGGWMPTEKEITNRIVKLLNC